MMDSWRDRHFQEEIIKSQHNQTTRQDVENGKLSNLLIRLPYEMRHKTQVCLKMKGS